MSKITIGLPVFNAAHTLPLCLRSIFAQTYRHWELIVIDDGSTDNSLDILNSIADARVRVFADGCNRGLAARLNEIGELAETEWIARMDADDVMLPSRLERQLAAVEGRPDIDLITSGTYSMTNDARLRGKRCPPFLRTDFDQALLGKTGIVHAATMYRRRWLQRNPYSVTSRRSQDYELWVRAALANDLRAITIPEPLYAYREDDNVTREKMIASYRLKIAVIRDSLPDQPLRRWGLLSRTLAKVALVNTIDVQRISEVLLQRRNRPVTAMDHHHFRAAMQAIQCSGVPGLS